MTGVRSWAPGRTEIAGNHTDHQGGRVIAATLDCQVCMELHEAADNRAQLTSAGFAPVDIRLDDTAPVVGEQLTTAALVRGVVAQLRAAGVDVGGFSAHVESDIPAGGGLSSSAAFELALGSGLNLLFGGSLGPFELALIGQTAERDWFGKPCGLMDQLAIALGGANLFDFGEQRDASSPEAPEETLWTPSSPYLGEERSARAEGEVAERGVSEEASKLDASPALPAVEHIPFDLGQYGYALCLIDTKCDHSAYTDEYARVAADMNDVAAFLGVKMLSQITEEALLERIGDVRAALGDLPALRALHYFNEMRLVDERARALHAGDFVAFLDATRQSGASSAQFLQNVSTFDRREQPAMVVLALATCLLAGSGAARIHGGGFGGSIQAFVPLDDVARFSRAIDAHLGVGSCKAYAISDAGAYAQWL